MSECLLLSQSLHKSGQFRGVCCRRRMGSGGTASRNPFISQVNSEFEWGRGLGKTGWRSQSLHKSGQFREGGFMEDIPKVELAVAIPS